MQSALAPTLIQPSRDRIARRVGPDTPLMLPLTANATRKMPHCPVSTTIVAAMLAAPSNPTKPNAVAVHLMDLQ